MQGLHGLDPAYRHHAVALDDRQVVPALDLVAVLLGGLDPQGVGADVGQHHFFQGRRACLEGRLVRDNVALGQLEMRVPKRPAGEVSLDVRFTYDINGLLEAQVSIPLTGESHSLVIENNPGVLTPEEIQERLKALAQLKIHPRDQQVNTLLSARLERLYQESLGELREQIGYWAGQFQQVLETQDERKIREVRSQLSEQLQHLENGHWH